MIYYRHLNNWNATVAHLEGKLWLHSFQHFQNIEDEGRRDVQEGRASGAIREGMNVVVANDEFPTQAVYILCFSERENIPHFGEYVIALKDKDALLGKIKDALPAHTGLIWQKVRYTNQMGYDREPGAREIMERAGWTKAIRFCVENEWRLIVYLPAGIKITNERLELDVGDLEGIFDIVRRGKDERLYGSDDLKPLDNIHDPDIRDSYWVKVPSGKAITFKEHYEHVASFKLLPSVPNDIQVQFDVARNLYVYAWYVYRLTSPAQAQAYATLEFALRERCKKEGLDPHPYWGLRRLLKTAINHGWVKDGGFVHLIGTPAWNELDPEGTTFARQLLDILPQFRNGFAHGGTTLLEPRGALMALESAVEIINQLYPEKHD
ncbi:MAG: hypothetical protein HOH80_15270 [Rhodospirillaceae bacterium]|jgi:hypothetical protein|nr:hypothetical protein [Rhodospirillales bacterium]MBT4117358.1 hypothetical protein [Rhodospirillaceae bacterium]MBT5840357.1 hypothetical protein [Rhodospirillaceae bacterium]MBT7235728.1 hypothetical protein [Rhodospirillaceae bacterium]MBT7570405.1 hypothetical protein [Rhodospirillaceae bacterium]